MWSFPEGWVDKDRRCAGKIVDDDHFRMVGISISQLLRHIGPDKQSRVPGGGTLQMDSGGWVHMSYLLDALPEMNRIKRAEIRVEKHMIMFLCLFGDKGRLELGSLVDSETRDV